ncbi:MAG TPA: dTMP kinase [Bacteroidota bacterium]|nr:dTMP kinase [Bacteroidota bacterium]
MFISFEGLDGSGKTTQAALLVDKLRSQSYIVEFFREPGGTEISERIREILLDKKNLGMSQITELFLFSAARAQLVNQVIKPALLDGKIVICDRYVDSTTAYQGYGRGLRLGAVKTINAVATFGLLPEITFLIDVPIDEIIERRHKSGVAIDRMESSGREFYEKIRQGYLELAKEEPKRIQLIDGSLPAEIVQDEIWKTLSVRLPRKIS